MLHHAQALFLSQEEVLKNFLRSISWHSNESSLVREISLRDFMPEKTLNKKSGYSKKCSQENGKNIIVRINVVEDQIIFCFFSYLFLSVLIQNFIVSKKSLEKEYRLMLSRKLSFCPRKRLILQV